MSDHGWFVAFLAGLVAFTLAASVAMSLRRRLRCAEHRLTETTAVRDALMQREQELAVHASHRLRTPITSLRLGLDDLTRWPQTSPEVRAELEHALVEIDRWGSAVDEVLGGARSRRRAAATHVDLSELTRSLVTRRRPETGRRRLTHRTRGPVPAVVDPSAVEEIVSILVDHLLAHGSGDLRVDVSTHATHLQIAVGDDSHRRLQPGVFRDDEGHAELGEAGAVAASLGGYLAVADRPKTRFLLMLPPPG